MSAAILPTLTPHGMSSTGFTPYTLQMIKSDLEAYYRSLWGSNVDLSETSDFGREIGIGAKVFADLWEQMEAQYYAAYPDSAKGAQLDLACELNAITRLRATQGSSLVAMTGTPGTLVGSGTQVQDESNNVVLALNNDTMLLTPDFTGCASVYVSIANITNPGSERFTISINGDATTHVSSIAASPTAIITALKGSLVTYHPEITVNVRGDDFLRIDTAVVGTTFTVSIIQTGGVDSDFILWTIGNFTCILSGNISLPANSITSVINSVSGLNAINNFEEGSSGRDTETDTDLRLRRKDSLFHLGGANLGAMRARMLNDVSAVKSCVIVENISDSYDAASPVPRPPHSVEFIIDANSKDATTNLAIAQEIWNIREAGIAVVSSQDPTLDLYVSTAIYDPNDGAYHTVVFSRISELAMTVVVSVHILSSYPANGDALIQQAIYNYGLTFSTGQEVVNQLLIVKVYEAVSNAIDSTIVTINGVTTNITPNSNERPIFSLANISVVHI